ncbi:MAB_1171c family putative transporter [Spongisporangium articulatum]|uniref:MAB_1171c family putative transporter n=1 Tax=Spongisporangium articulatum TaxID=3362603 RepID=A0ABW8AQ78_9ACTN
MLDGRGSLGTDAWVHVVLALACWTVVLLRRPEPETGRVGRLMWAGLVGLAAGSTFDAWPLNHRLDGLLPGRPVAGALYGGATMLGCGLGVLAIIEWAAPDWLDRRARRIVYALLALVVTAELVALLSLPAAVTVVDVPDHRLAEQLALHPQAYVSLVISSPLLTVGLIITSRCCLWYRHLAPDGPSARALQRILVANALLTGWMVLRLIGLVLVIGGSRIDVGGLFRASDLSFELAILGYLAAFLSLRDAWGRLRAAVVDRRALRRMRPLWSRTVAVHPQVVLRTDGWLRDAVDPRDLGMRRYRRVIEFRDAVLLLLPFLDAGRRGRVRAWLEPRVAPPDLDLMADAVELELARRDALRGRPSAWPGADPGDLARFGPLLRGGHDVEAEVRVLLRVAALAGDVDRVVERFAAGPDMTGGRAGVAARGVGG